MNDCFTCANTSFSHLHFHVIPRMPDQPADLRGPGVFAAFGREDAVPTTEMDELAESLARALQGR